MGEIVGKSLKTKPSGCGIVVEKQKHMFEGTKMRVEGMMRGKSGEKALGG